MLNTVLRVSELAKLKKANIDWQGHRLMVYGKGGPYGSHTFAVTALQKGLSLPALQHILGHDRLNTTEIFLDLSPEDVGREFRQKW